MDVHIESHDSAHMELGNCCTENFKKLKTYLSSELTLKLNRPTTTLEDVAGLKEVKSAIFEKLGDNSEMQDRILLFGATGTGKSHLVQAIANNLDANLITLMTCSMFLPEWAENMDMYTKVIFQLCREKGGLGTILFFDWLDCFPVVFEEGARNWNLVGFISDVQLAWRKAQDEGQQSGHYSQLSIFAATTEPKLLDEKLVYSFPQRIYVPTLNFQERKELLQRTIEKSWKSGHGMQQKDLDTLVRT